MGRPFLLEPAAGHAEAVPVQRPDQPRYGRQRGGRELQKYLPMLVLVVHRIHNEWRALLECRAAQIRGVGDLLLGTSAAIDAVTLLKFITGRDHGVRHGVRRGHGVHHGVRRCHGVRQRM